MWLLFTTYLVCEYVQHIYPPFSHSHTQHNEPKHYCKGEMGDMLAWLVSIGWMKTNNRHKPQK